MTLEEYRKVVIEQIRENVQFIRDRISLLLGIDNFDIYLHGSVLNPKEFNENSDIDLAVVIRDNNLDRGIDLDMSEHLAGKLHIGDAGVLDVVVLVNMKPENALSL